MLNLDSYHYDLLDYIEKKAYDAIVIGAKRLDPKIRIPKNLSMENIKKIVEFVLYDNEYEFWIGRNFQVDEGEGCKYLLLTYTHSMREIEKDQAEINQELGKIKNKYQQLGITGELETIRFVHDYFLDNYSYDYSFKEISHTILGVFKNKKAVCDGISKAFRLVLRHLLGKNVAMVVVGQAKNPSDRLDVQAHAWVMVIIDGYTYWLDVTYNMTLSKGIHRFDYFNICSMDILKSHTPDYPTPECRVENANFFRQRGLIANNMRALENLINKHLEQGIFHFQLKLRDMVFTQILADEIMRLAQACYEQRHNSGAVVHLSYNKSQLVFEILLEKPKKRFSFWG